MPELNIYSPKTTLLGEVYRPEPELRVSVEWNTLIRENRGGKENRTAKLSEPRYRLEGSDFVLTDTTYTALSDFFNNRLGKQLSFEFKCPLDYYCTAIPEVYSTNVSQQGVLVLIAPGIYQICKKYTVNNVSSYKSITKPIAGTITLFDGTTPITGTVDVTTGRVTGISPVNGLVDCEFNLPFRFDVDDLQLNQIKRAVTDYRLNNDTSVYTAINFSLIEDNYTKVSPLLAADWTTDIIYTFDGYPLTEIAYSTRNTVRVESADNQREVREAQGSPRNVYKLGQNNLNWISLQKFFTLFQASKGRLLGFTFEGDLVRLNQDNFTAERIAESVWSFDGLDMIQVLNPSSNEVKNCAHCIAIDSAPIPPEPPAPPPAPIISSFAFNLGIPLEAKYPRTISAPQSVQDIALAGFTVNAYLISGYVDNGFESVQVPTSIRQLVGDFTGTLPSGGLFMGTGTNIDVLILQLGPAQGGNLCNFGGQIRWEFS